MDSAAGELFDKMGLPEVDLTHTQLIAAIINSCNALLFANPMIEK